MELRQFQRMQALDAWLKETNTTLTQLNGQRKYGGPPEVWDGPPPGKCCEVFISHIPRDVYEDLLIPLFRSVGPLWEFRLMMNFSGQNRGFAYAKYGTNALAMKAIQKLNGYMIEPNCYLCVRYSIEKRHLSIHNLPSSTSVQNLQEVLQVLVEGVERVSLKTGPGIDGVSAVVGFSSHFTASMAKKVLAAGERPTPGGSSVFPRSPTAPLKGSIPSEPLLSISCSVLVCHMKCLWSDYLQPVFRTDNVNVSPLCLDLKKHCSLEVFVTWEPGEDLSPKQPSCSQAPKILMQPCFLPCGQANPDPPVPSQGFCGAVGKPVSLTSLQPLVSPVVVLHRFCELNGYGQPLYELSKGLPRSDGFVEFFYKVLIQGVRSSFRGTVMVLPGPNCRATIDEARRAIAQQLLLKMPNSHLAA
uniref:DND microRNA-mediated repression inhibitor 1 n=1 Tax=Cyprinodon variegatus TaxID=28743 RepID=A0A3Q2FDA7_CYPVA